jgi:hypothetical protein
MVPFARGWFTVMIGLITDMMITRCADVHTRPAQTSSGRSQTSRL